MLRKFKTPIVLAWTFLIAAIHPPLLVRAQDGLSDQDPSDTQRISALLDGMKYALATHADPSALQVIRDDTLKLASSIEKHDPQKAALLRTDLAATLDGILQTSATLRDCGLKDAATDFTDRLGKKFVYCDDRAKLMSLSLGRFATQLEHLTETLKPKFEQSDSAEWLRQTLVKNARYEMISVYYGVYSKYTAKMPEDGAAAIELMTGKPPISDPYANLMLDKKFKFTGVDDDLIRHLTVTASLQPEGVEVRRANAKAGYEEMQSDILTLRDLNTTAMHNGTAAYLLDHQDDPFHPKRPLHPAPLLSPSLPIPLNPEWQNPVENLMSGKYAESARTVISLPDDNMYVPGSFRMIPAWVAERESAHPDPQRLAQLESWMKSEMNTLFPGKSDEIQSKFIEDFSRRLGREGYPSDLPTLSRMFKQSLDSVEVTDRFGNPNQAINIPREEYWVNKSAFEGKEEAFKFNNPVSYTDEFRSAVGRQYDGTFDHRDFFGALQSFYQGARDYVAHVEDDRTGDPRKAIKDMLMRDPGLVAPTLAENPELASLVCQLWNEIPVDLRRKELGRKIRMWGEGLLVGGAAVATVVMPFVGAPALYTLSVAGVGTAAGLTQAGDMAYQGFQLKHEAELAHTYLIARGIGDPDEIEREFSRANALITGAIVEGAISLASASALLRAVTKSPEMLKALSESKDAVIAAARRLGAKAISPITPGERFAKFASAADKYIDELDSAGNARLFIKDKPITDQEFLRISRGVWDDPDLSITQKLRKVVDAMKRANKPVTPDTLEAIWNGNQSDLTKVMASLRHGDDKAIDWFETRFLPEGKGLTSPVKFAVMGVAGVTSVGLTTLSLAADHKEKKDNETYLKDELGGSYDMADIRNRINSANPSRKITTEQALQLVKERIDATQATFELTRHLAHERPSFDATSLSRSWDAAKDRISGAFSKKKEDTVNIGDIWKSAILKGGQLQPAFSHLTYYVDDGTLREDGTPRHTIWNNTKDFQRLPGPPRDFKAPLPNEQKELLFHQVEYLTLRNGMERWYPPANAKPKIFSGEEKDAQRIPQTPYLQKVFERLKDIRDGKYSSKTMTQSEFINKMAQYLDETERLRDYQTLGFVRVSPGPDGKNVPFTEKDNEAATLDQLNQLYPPKAAPHGP